MNARRLAGRARQLCALALLGSLFGACRAAPGGSSPPEPSAGAADSAADASAPDASARACSRDDQCAVARIETSGPHICCPAQATTPGTRAWHLALQQRCATHPPADCAPLAGPEGPTRAICRDGVCEATATGPDGGPVRVPVEERCLPAMVCGEWKGCALVAGNAQDGWYVAQGEQVSRGAPAGHSDNVCQRGERCEAALVAEPGVICPAFSATPQITAPPYTCHLEEGRCISRPAPPGPPTPPAPIAFDGPALASRLTAAAATCTLPPGSARKVRVTLTVAPGGAVISASLSPPYAGTPTGECLLRAFRAVTVPAFSGAPQTMLVELSLR